MNIRNSREDYGAVAKALHWLIAACMMAALAAGWYMSGLSDERVLYWRLLDLHEALGLGLLVVVPLKIVWRLYSPNPRPPRGLSRWERRAARVVHEFFTAAALAIPATGFLFVATNGEAVRLYDLLTIPDLGRWPAAVRGLLSGAHYYLAYSCAALIAVHVLAALKHRFFDGGGAPRRMTF